jgi:hypothetical protein
MRPTDERTATSGTAIVAIGTSTLQPKLSIGTRARKDNTFDPWAEDRSVRSRAMVARNRPRPTKSLHRRRLPRLLSLLVDIAKCGAEVQGPSNTTSGQAKSAELSQHPGVFPGVAAEAVGASGEGRRRAGTRRRTTKDTSEEAGRIVGWVDIGGRGGSKSSWRSSDDVVHVVVGCFFDSCCLGQKEQLLTHFSKLLCATSTHSTKANKTKPQGRR